MKYRFFTGIIFPLVLLAACKDGPILSSYRMVLPELPRHWEEILGAAHWRLEWVGAGGSWMEEDVPPGREAPELSPVPEWTTAVLAWPYWPARDLKAGMMRPAGALFPWDSSGGELTLGWRGGVEALFWKELAIADRSTAASEGRLPWYFDWPRFRELLYESGDSGGALFQDPWLPDWKAIAQKTVQSGFDRRRIVSRNFTEITVPGFGGRWIGSSPFAPPLDVPEGGSLCLNITDRAEIWISSGGILKCSTSGWVWREQ